MNEHRKMQKFRKHTVQRKVTQVTGQRLRRGVHRKKHWCGWATQEAFLNKRHLNRDQNEKPTTLQISEES